MVPGKIRAAIIVALACYVLLSATTAAAVVQMAGAATGGLVPHGERGHVCGTDLSSPTERAALSAYRTARDRGLLPVARKAASPPEVGDQQTFVVIENGAWREYEFELMDLEDGLYNLWVELGELASGRITNDVVAELRGVLVEATPGGTYDPGAGVMANNEALLGPPPDYDGDGVTDVLMYDIDPDDSTPGSFTAGYVTSTDINPNASAGIGNQADILYLDSNQGISSGAYPSTAAHEYAHLIHFNTGFDSETFISEGIAEYMTVINGLGRSSYPFMSLQGEPEMPLLTWRSDVEVLRDYARGELFFRYLGDQFGSDLVSDIAANTYKGSAGVDSVLTRRGRSLSGVLLDYHSANLVDDARYGGRFAHGAGVETIQPAVASSFSGSSSSGTPPFTSGTRPQIEAGAATYLKVTSIADLRLQFDAAAGDMDSRSNLGARIFLRDDTNQRTYRDVFPGSGEILIPGNFIQAQVVFASLDPALTAPLDLDYIATWAGYGQATATPEEEELPQIVDLDQNYPNPFNSSTRVRFSLPAAAHASLSVHDQLGRRIATLWDGLLPPGTHESVFDATGLSSGMYVYVLRTGETRSSRIMTLLK